MLISKKEKKNTYKHYQKFHNFFEFPDRGSFPCQLQFIVYRITLRWNAFIRLETRTKNKYFISHRYAHMKSFIISLKLNFLNVIRGSVMLTFLFNTLPQSFWKRQENVKRNKNSILTAKPRLKSTITLFPKQIN